MCRLLLDKVLQFVDGGQSFRSCSSVYCTFLALLQELEDFISNLVEGFFANGYFEKLFLEFLQSFVNTISDILLIVSITFAMFCWSCAW